MCGGVFMESACQTKDPKARETVEYHVENHAFQHVKNATDGKIVAFPCAFQRGRKM